MTLWQPGPDYPTHVATVRTLATHLLARARFEATGRFGLRPTPGGLGTPAFGAAGTRVRFSGATLVVEVAGDDGAATRVLPMDGRTLGELAEFVGVTLDPEFSVGADTAELPSPEEVVHLDETAARQVGGWFAFTDTVLVRLLHALPGMSPTALQVWPEHFDLGTDLAAAPGGPRMNVGGSPGDGFSAEPYLYVGPHGPDRPGDPAYWNAPFGASVGLAELAAAEHPDDAALEFFLRGARLLAAG